MGSRGRIVEQIPQLLFIRQRCEKLGVVERGVEQFAPLGFRQRVGGIAGKKSADTIGHGFFSQLPPTRTSNSFRQRASQVYTVLMDAAPSSF